uniref:Small ribosomal subunit protein mS29 n=1 Tax=Timema bartmani TaxID=61472 RepID=A0A7R9I7Q3_9NEOP|nr:unnamed protein product [Timema bartmani]
MVGWLDHVIPFKLRSLKSNGAVVVTVDQIAASDDRQASVLPLYQLGKEEVVLHISHSLLMSSDRVKPRSGDWAITSDFQEVTIISLSSGSNGFEHMDPFVPIRVSEYNAKEIESCLQYYIDRRWIQNPNLRTEDGRKELAFLSGNNPYHLMNMCTPL